MLSERGEWPSDAAIFALGGRFSGRSRRANREEESRIRLLKRLSRQDEAVEYVYMAYLGFLLRRRRVASAAEKFPLLADISQALLLKRPAGLKSLPKSVRREDNS